jgi:hypothetical protein
MWTHGFGLGAKEAAAFALFMSLYERLKIVFELPTIAMQKM